MSVVWNKPLPPVVDKYRTEQPVERIFDNGVVGAVSPSVYQDLGSEEGYQAAIREIIDDAYDHEENYLAPAREKLLDYYYGELPLVESVDDDGEPTSSTVVSTDVRDTVMAIIPSMMRTYMSREHIVYCSPNYEGQEDGANQATDYLEHVFWKDNPGFNLLHDALKDVLSTKACVARWWTEEENEVKQQLFRNITPEQMQMLISERPDIEIVNEDELQESEEEPGTLKEVIVRWYEKKVRQKLVGVPLDEFRVNKGAKTVEDATCIGQDSLVRTSWLIGQGYDPEVIDSFRNPSRPFSADRQFRSEALDSTYVGNDYEVRYGEYFIRIDADGDGVDELHRICTIGDTYTIIADDIVQHANFAVGSSDLKPHTLIGDCPADLVMDIQRIKTNMLRGSLDSLAQSIWPRTVFNEVLVNVDDVLNDEIGAAIRTKGNPSDTVMSINHTFVGEPVFKMFDQMEMLRTRRTGISDASKGLDPKALQSTNVNGIDAIVSGQQERIELIALIFAHTFLAPVFVGLLREMTANPSPQRTVKIRGKWTPIDPSTFDPDMGVEVNDTLGKGSDVTRLMALQEVKSTQIMIIEKFGVKNPVVGPEEFRNTVVDMLAIANIKNTTRYFKEIDPEMMAGIMEAPDEPAPEQLLAQAELEKARGKAAEAVSKQNFNVLKLRVDDDFRRDELMIDSFLEAADIEMQAAEFGGEGELEDEPLVREANKADA